MKQGNEDGGYTNGFSNGFGRRYDTDASSREASADERSQSRGAGGYGGFGRNQPVGQRVLGPSQLERRQANRRSADRGWSASRSRSRQGGRLGEGNRQVEG